MGAWFLATEFYDLDGDWHWPASPPYQYQPEYASDGITWTAARYWASGWSGFLEFRFTEIFCSQIKWIYSSDRSEAVSEHDVDIYYDSAWHDLFQAGGFTKLAWNYYTIPDEGHNISRVRIRVRNSTSASIRFELSEMQFYGSEIGVPVAPTNCVATANGPSQITLTWNDNSYIETGYEIQRKIDFGSWESVTTTEADVEVYVDATASVRPAQYYEYRVRAVAPGPLYSDWCTSNAVLTPAAPPWYQADSDDGGGADWTNGAKAYDDSLSTYATGQLPLDGSWSTWLELTYASMLLKATQVKLLLATPGGGKFHLQVQAMLGGIWQTVIDSWPDPTDPSGRTWASGSFSKSTLTKLRVRGCWSSEETSWRLIEIYSYAEAQATQYIVPLAIDETAGYLYAAGHLAPGEVVKIDLITFQAVDRMQFGAGENYPRCSVVHSATKAYFGLYVDPGKIVRLNLLDFFKDATKTLGAAGEKNFMGADIHVSGDYAYFACWQEPGKVVRVKLSDFTDSTLTLASGDDRPWPVLVDPDKGYLYLGLWTVPGKIVTVKLSNLVRESRLTLSAALETLSCGAIDTVNKYAYFGAMMSPGKIVKVRVAT